MTTLTQSLLAAFVLATAASAANAAQPVDQNAFFDQQRQITDGYYPRYNVVPRDIRPETEAQRAENDWLDAERASDSNGSRPVPFRPVITVTQHGMVAKGAPQAGVPGNTEATGD